jgi:hypothetical protein
MVSDDATGVGDVGDVESSWHAAAASATSARGRVRAAAPSRRRAAEREDDENTRDLRERRV